MSFMLCDIYTFIALFTYYMFMLLLIAIFFGSFLILSWWALKWCLFEKMARRKYKKAKYVPYTDNRGVPYTSFDMVDLCVKHLDNDELPVESPMREILKYHTYKLTAMRHRWAQFHAIQVEPHHVGLTGPFEERVEEAGATPIEYKTFKNVRNTLVIRLATSLRSELHMKYPYQGAVKDLPTQQCLMQRACSMYEEYTKEICQQIALIVRNRDDLVTIDELKREIAASRLDLQRFLETGAYQDQIDTMREVIDVLEKRYKDAAFTNPTRDGMEERSTKARDLEALRMAFTLRKEDWKRASALAVELYFIPSLDEAAFMAAFRTSEFREKVASRTGQTMSLGGFIRYYIFGILDCETKAKMA